MYKEKRKRKPEFSFRQNTVMQHSSSAPSQLPGTKFRCSYSHPLQRWGLFAYSQWQVLPSTFLAKCHLTGSDNVFKRAATHSYLSLPTIFVQKSILNDNLTGQKETEVHFQFHLITAILSRPSADRSLLFHHQHAAGSLHKGQLFQIWCQIFSKRDHTAVLRRTVWLKTQEFWVCLGFFLLLLPINKITSLSRTYICLERQERLTTSSAVR